MMSSPQGMTPLYPFVGVPTFLRAPVVEGLEPNTADIAVIGVPFDEGQPFIPGARFGPRAIREHSVRFARGDGCFDQRSGQMLLDRELRERRIVDLGDAEVLVTDVETTFDRTTALVENALQAGALPVVLGGDHSITYPIVRAFQRPLTVVQLDAHLDYTAPQGRLRYTNTNAFHHIAGLATVPRIVQAGIRGLRNSRAVLEASLEDGNAVLSIDELREGGPGTLLANVPDDAPCFLSLDIDVLDAPLVPGCVSAEYDGLSYAELRDILWALAEAREIIGLDLVEVNPMVDVPSGATAYLATNLLVLLLGAIAAQPRWQAGPSAASAAGVGAREA